ncbi:MAG: PD-(D/E)XK nuclease family protein [Oscillospiraceae bacterium]|nr:PD-(D/E)XK nuclease family protein [Oscillospiraceae bacterium]
MLTLLLGTDWTANRDVILNMVSSNVAKQQPGSILIVPELISHDTERRLCAVAGDTTSRFAEVLTFSRLADRVAEAAGLGAPACLDNGGRLVAMASATGSLHSVLKAYASVETKPEFLTALLDGVDEFKRCCISSDDLRAASWETEGSLAQKLEELALILDAYNSLCARGKRDPRDQMTWLLEQLEDSTFGKDHIFYIDGFPDFTRQHTAILSYLIGTSASVVVSLNCDKPGSESPAFEKAGATAAELLRIAGEQGVPVRIQQIQPRNDRMEAICGKLFAGKIQPDPTNADMLKVYRTQSVYDECLAVAEQICNLVRSGCRYRDISIVLADEIAYGNLLHMVLTRFHIPVYQSGTDDILEKSVITTVLSALDAAIGGFEQSDVFRYLKSILSPLDLPMCDELENYAVVWNITGNGWKNTWINHPEGLQTVWTDRDREKLEALNAAREKALSPLICLSERLHQAQVLQDMVDALYSFLDDLQLDDRLSVLAQQMEDSADLRNMQILIQLQQILLQALEQLRDILGNIAWDVLAFTKLLKLLLSQYDVGTIPAVLDAVTVGSISAMRCQQSEYLFVLGAAEGALPGYTGSVGVLTDQERTQLRLLGVPLTGGAIEGLQAEFAEIYGVFCGAQKGIYVSCGSSEPSYLYRRLSQMAGGDFLYTPKGYSYTDKTETAAYLARLDAENAADDLGISRQYAHLRQCAAHELGQVSSRCVRGIYGETLNLSASQIDKAADCRLAYFLRYGLRLKERKVAEVDPAEFGTYVHAVLESCGRDIQQRGGFRKVTLEETLELARKYSQAYIAEKFQQIDSQRVNYLFRRNAQELEMVVTELWEELQDSEFEPIAFELAFGMEGGLDSIFIPGSDISARLRGFVDRVDAWLTNEQTYYRVVDYKTGKKDFDYCDIFNGLGLQMLLYMFALEDNGQQLLGEHPVAAGVQYFPARAPVVCVDNPSDADNIRKNRELLWKRKGLLLSDDDVLAAMESSEKPKRLSYSRRKDGALSGDVADRTQLQLLKAYVYGLLSKMVDEIASGVVEPNPYSRGTRHNACAFCPYGAICHRETVEGRRDFATMQPQRFWDEIEKEVRSRG